LVRSAAYGPRVSNGITPQYRHLVTNHAHTNFQSVTTIRKRLRVNPCHKGEVVPLHVMKCRTGCVVLGPLFLYHVSKWRRGSGCQLLPHYSPGGGGMAVGADCLRVWVGPRVSLDVLEKKNLFKLKMLAPFHIFLYNKPLFRSVFGI